MTRSDKKFFSLLLLALAIGGVGAVVFVKSQSRPPSPNAAVQQQQAADAPAGQTKTFWAKRCTKDEKSAVQSCEIFQRLVVKENNTRLTEVALSPPRAEQEARIAVIVPLGVTVSGGVAMQVDEGQQFNAPLQTCNQTGCLSLIKMPEGFIETMQRGTLLNVGFLDGQNQTIKIQMPLKGFADAWAEIQ